jgi:hypothetical protein
MDAFEPISISLQNFHFSIIYKAFLCRGKRVPGPRPQSHFLASAGARGSREDLLVRVTRFHRARCLIIGCLLTRPQWPVEAAAAAAAAPRGLEQQQQQQRRPEDSNSSSSSSGGGGGFGGGDIAAAAAAEHEGDRREEFKDSADKHWICFARAMESNPEQALRYSWSGRVLRGPCRQRAPHAAHPACSSVSCCRRCCGCSTWTR